MTPEIILFEKSQIHFPSTHKLNIRLALFFNIELIIEVLSTLKPSI